ncbi:MAG: DEAD/DEAH box helicase family protein [Candidatus Korarchaeota archaeon]|nr:DEAD/DEAH box helicase family protein [Candidatus Korarchaeota archaeon]
MRYDRGTIVVEGVRTLQHCTWDPRIGALRTLGYRYRYLKQIIPEAIDDVLNPLQSPNLEEKVSLKPFQYDALESWLNRRRGIIVLPTGAGKTYIALKAMELLNVPTLVVVPTLPLLKQWRDVIESLYHVNVGVIGGGQERLEPITVITYDSAYLRAAELGNRFEFVVFDEVHHLAAEGYIEIAEYLVAPYRMGLTATLEREDGRHRLLFPLVGGVVYQLFPKDLSGEHLSEFDTIRIRVDMTDDEKRRYKELVDEYKSSLKRAGISIRSLEDFRKLVMRSTSNKAARRALLAWHEARKLAINSRAKLDVLKDLLESHREDKVIIFTEFNDIAEEISRKFLIPLITHRTKHKEREKILQAFRIGAVTKVVTSKVLDEGIDVPDARVGIILGGTGSRREFVQRLGRILRKREGKRAVLYEIISRGTTEVRISSKRRKGLEI